MAAVLFRDALFNIVFAFFVMLWMLIPHIHDPAEENKADPPGNLAVVASWISGDIDIDVWMDGPGELAPVGYSSKSGVLIDLLRDDLGKMPDATDLNFETAFTRGVVPGVYVVNLHVYRSPVYPIPVTVEVSINTGEPGKSAMRPLVTTKVILTRYGEERTAIRFKLRADGTIEPNSMNSIYVPLRSRRK